MPCPSLSPPARGLRTAKARRRLGPVAALALVATLLASPAAATQDPRPGPHAPQAGGAAAAEPRGPRPRKPADDDPLRVHLTSISPDTLSDDDRPLTISGTVSNTSFETWTGINLYSFRSVAPIADATSLAASAAIEPDAYVGDRIVEAGTEARVEELAPGESADFSLTVPRDLLTINAPGVYWLGIHARGASETVPHDDFTDGRARTFIPFVADARRRPAKGDAPDPVQAAIVLPLRERVWLAADGSVARPGRWRKSLIEGGRLEALLDAGDSAAGTPLTWLVDPAVLVAIARLGAGNPPRTLAPDPDALPVTGEPTDPSSTAGATPEGATTQPDPAGVDHEPVPAPDPEQELTAWQQELATTATAWLERFTALTAGKTVLALPYGDLDAAAAAAHAPAFYEQAVARSSQVMTWLGIQSSPALAPRQGVLSPAALQAATPDSTVLVADTSFAVPPDTQTSMVRLLDHDVVVTSSGAAAGGPGPGAPDDALALRQRLLSEAAVRGAAGSTAPVVMVLPHDWHPVDPAALFTGLDKRWLTPVTVAEVAQRPAASLSGNDLAYTEEDEALELPATNFEAAAELADRAALMGGVLTLPNLVPAQVADEILVMLSSGHRTSPDRALRSTRAAEAHIDEQLASITVEAPDAVTLSSENGNLGADVVNGLDQPVTVRVTAAASDGDLQVQDPEDLQLDPGARKRIRPRITADRPGIHQVRLLVTDTQGQPLGASTSLQIRAAQVSGLIWLLLAGGALLLFGTIAVRLVRRIRSSRQAPAPAEEATP